MEIGQKLTSIGDGEDFYTIIESNGNRWYKIKRDCDNETFDAYDDGCGNIEFSDDHYRFTLKLVKDDNKPLQEDNKMEQMLSLWDKNYSEWKFKVNHDIFLPKHVHLIQNVKNPEYVKSVIKTCNIGIHSTLDVNDIFTKDNPNKKYLRITWNKTLDKYYVDESGSCGFFNRPLLIDEYIVESNIEFIKK